MNPINQEKISKLKKRKKTWIQKLRDWICLSFNVVTVILGSLPHKSTFTRKKEGKIRARNRRQRQRRGPLFFSEGSLSHRSQRARAFIQVWIAEVVWFRCFFGVPIIIGFTQYFEVTRTHTTQMLGHYPAATKFYFLCFRKVHKNLMVTTHTIQKSKALPKSMGQDEAFKAVRLICFWIL